jgi:hypothetical protein
MHKTFLCAHTHRNHQPQIQHAKCVRLTSASFPVQLCRSKAYAKCQCMDLRVAQRSMSRTKQSMYISTHAPYLEREHAHTHTHHIFYRKRTHTIYFTREETMHKTFPCAQTPRNHQAQIQHAQCVRPTFFNHCCVSSAAAQKQSTCKCQGMDSLLAQRSMIRA